MRKRGVDPSHPPIIEDETPFVPSRGWAEMIRKVYQIDPFICPQCGGRMTIYLTLKIDTDQKDYLRFYRIYEVHKTPNTTEPDRYSQTQPQKV